MKRYKMITDIFVCANLCILSVIICVWSVSDMVNLRRYARLRAEVDVDYYNIDAPKARKAGFAQSSAPLRVRTKSYNISIGGICFATPDRFKIGARAALEIFLDDNDPVKTEGNIIWYKEFEDGTCRAGVKFVDLKEEDKEKFSNFIFRKMYEMTGVGSRSGLVKYAKAHGWQNTDDRRWRNTDERRWRWVI